jgi:hypothetical protein
LEKNISILAKATQVSDVAHGPLVLKRHYLQKQKQTKKLSDSLSCSITKM